jgi:spoIIIJ-associated protein
VEWVETTGRTIEEAKDAALDQLGVDEQDAEFEIVEDAKLGLFGRIRSEARVRARVQPKRPRPKDERRDRRRRGEARGEPRADGESSAAPREAKVKNPAEVQARPPRAQSQPRRTADEQRRPKPDTAEDGGTGVEVSLSEQAESARTFLLGLVEQFGMQGDVQIAEVDEDTVELQVTGNDLGLLIGPKGQTLQAIQELTRTAVQRHAGGASGRLLVDVAGYRQKRRAALEAFTRQQVERVQASGTRLVLEPMSPADRKVVHDTVNGIDGVRTTSEGEEPRRRVVIMPDGD